MDLIQQQVQYIKDNMPEAYAKIVEIAAKEAKTGVLPLPIFNEDDEIVGYSAV